MEDSKTSRIELQEESPSKETKKEIWLAKAVIKKDGKYLLLFRAPGHIYEDLWDFPGGRIKHGETPEEAVTREVNEETSLTIDPGKQISTTTHEDMKYILNYTFFKPKDSKGEITLSGDHTKSGWFTKEEIKNLEIHSSISTYLGW